MSSLPAPNPSPFVHLHVHTQYSLLQGAMHMDALIARAVELGMDSIAVTDMHNLFGAIDFYNAAKKAKLKPILGCEVFFAPQGRAGTVPPPGTPPNQSTTLKLHHLVLLCKDFTGYQNLCQLLTQSYRDVPPPQKGQPAPARALIDREMLDKHGDGLIVLSGCIKGELAYKAITGEHEQALQSLLWFKKRFGEDFYLELQDSGIPEQESANQILFDWGQKHAVECVATVDCHYLHPHDAEAHEVLQCIEHNKNLDFERPRSLVPSEYYLKPGSLMVERFESFPGAISNTRKIADRCDLKFPFQDEKGRTIYQLPQFRPTGVPKDAPFDLIAYFREASQKGLEARFEEWGFREKVKAPNWQSEGRAVYTARLEDELRMIEQTGFAGYFLIVSDFILWAKAQGIPVGPGRGSGAGSLVAYALQITDIDPIEFVLLFERFINPERISMPDFDIDFCQDRRGEVIDYVSQKYGSENVAQIITFGKLQARAVVKDVGRVLGMSFADTDQINKLIPETLGIELADALIQEPRIKERMEADPKIAKLMEYALKLEGLYRNAGIHAAGVIITDKPVVNYCPLYIGKDGDAVTQYDKDYCEAIGLVKFDFLGLKTLTVIDNAIKLVHQSALPGSPDKEFALERMNYKDPNVFALISSGDCDGVFQVESSGMKDLCTRLQPSSIEDLTALGALYRPGPLGSGMVDVFVDRKHGREPNNYEVPQLEPILRDTYGVIVYQEQVMQIARELGGYSLGQADLLRRAMGKKKPEEMALHRAIFAKGAAEKGIAVEKAESIFDLMAKFAEYGFNKSHSCAYGVLTYQTAYLKTYYPAEFMAALMTTEMDNTDKITKYIGDARAHHIPVLAPDVNRSQKRFSVERVEATAQTAKARKPSQAATPLGAESESPKAIRFGLEAIKGVGGIAVDTILAARATPGSPEAAHYAALAAAKGLVAAAGAPPALPVAGGPFKNVLDFCRRVSTRKANKKVLESLTLAGAFDSIAEVNRASLFGSLEQLLDMAGDEQEERELGQDSLFDAFVGSSEIKPLVAANQVFKQEEEWPVSRKLTLEKQVVGFYVSGHPMDTWQRICEDWLGWSVARLKSFAEEKAAARKSAPAAQEMPQWGMGGDGGGGGGGGGRFRAPKTEVKLGGLLSELKEVMTKKGSRMAFANIEDLHGKVEVIFFPEAYATNQEILKRAVAEAEPIVLVGDVEIGDEATKILAKTVEWAAEAHKSRVQHVTLRLQIDRVTPDQLRELKRRLLAHRGRCPVRIDFLEPRFKTRLDLPKAVSVAATTRMVEEVNQIFGGNVVHLV